MRLLLLVGLVAILGWLVVQRRNDAYPFVATTLPSGQSFDTYALPDDCQRLRPACIRRVAYLTELTDTTALKAEARVLLPWLVQKQPALRVPAAVGIIAVRAGALRLAPPTHAYHVTFALRDAATGWEFYEINDVTPQLTRLFKGELK